MKKQLTAIFLAMLLFCGMNISVNAVTSNGDTYEIPRNVTTVTHNDVRGLTNITTLIIHENVVKIGYNVFCQMPNLKEVYMYTKHNLDDTWDIGINDLTAGYDFTVYGYENVRRWVEHTNNPYLDNTAGLGKFMPNSNFINFVLLEEEQNKDEADSQIIPPVQNVSEIKVVVNGQSVQFDVPPQIINNRTMIPLRAVAEAFGAEVEWYQDSKSIRIRGKYPKSDYLHYWMNLQIGSDSLSYAQFNSDYTERLSDGMNITLDSPPIIVDSRTLVPIRAIAETLWMNVEWDGSTRTVYIYE